MAKPAAAKYLLLLGAIGLLYGCYRTFFFEVRYYAHYPHMELYSWNSSQWSELRTGMYVDDGDDKKVAPLYVNLDGKVFFLPDLTETNASEYCYEPELRSAEGANPITGLRQPDESGRTTYSDGFNQFSFRHGRLVGASFKYGSGSRVGTKPEGPFRSTVMTRAEATELFGEPLKIEKKRVKANWVFR